MNTAVFQDTKYNSGNYSKYVEIAVAKEKERLKKLGKELTPEQETDIREEFKEYAGSKIGDGQGWISFDSYRDLMLSMRKWTGSQEKLYWDIIKGKDVNELQVLQFFPVLKMQYGGELATNVGLPVQGYHKFSLMPLIPNVIKDSHLETLHNKMTEQGIDYALFQSGSKINTITKDGTPDQFYIDNENLGDVAFSDPDYEFTVNPIYTNFFKLQLETADVYKSKVVFSTQLRTIIEDGLYEEGRPRSFGGTKEQFDDLSPEEKSKYVEYVKITNYEKLVYALTERKYKELQKNAGLVFEDGKFVLSEKLIDYLNKQLTIQDVAEHEIDFIKYDARNKKLVFDLSIHPSAAMLDKLLSALIYKKIVNQKVNGEALIQVSGAGFEPSGTRKATNEENKLYENGTLPFYEYSKSGTKAMKVKVALQGDFKKLLRHPDVIERAKKGISELAALNELLKDDAWMKENRKMVTIAGVRIPVQGLNSVEFMEVYEFLPENAGNMIILPADIVAKSGSDFDIDKLSLMFPNLKIIGNKVKLLKYNEKEAKIVDSNKQLLKDLYDHLDILFQKLNSLETDKKQDDLYKVILEYKDKKEKLIDEIWGDFKNVGAEELEALHEELHEIKFTLSGLYNKSKKLSAEVTKIFEEEINPTFEEIDNVIEDIASASTKAIENDLMFAVVDIASMEENFVEFITPNSTSVLKPYSTDLNQYSKYNKYKNGNGETLYDGKGKKRIAATKIFELGFNRYKLSSNNIGMQSLGIAAVSNKYNRVLVKVGAYMEKQLKLGVKKGKPDSGYDVIQTFKGGIGFNRTANNEISLAGLYAADGIHRISKLISQLINGTVDVAKDSWIFDIQGNKEMMSILSFMFQAGVPPKQAVYFLSQPIIKEYVEKQRNIKSAFAKPLGVESAGTNMFRVEARRQILSDNSALTNFLMEKGIDPVLFKAQEFTNRNLKKTVYTRLVPEILNGTEDFSLETLTSQLEKPESLDQLQVFLHFIEIEEMSKAVTEIQQGLNFDTNKLPSMFEIKSKLDNLDSLNKDKRLNTSIVNDIINNSPIGSFIKFIDFDAVFQSLFPVRTDGKLYEALRTSFPTLSDEIIEDYSGRFKDYSDLANAFIDDFTNYIYQQYNLAILKTFDPFKPFKGLNIDGSVKSIPVEKSLFLSRGGVFVKDGSLFVDLNSVRSDYDNKKYSEITSSAGVPGPAPVSSEYFDDSRDNNISFHKYVKFLYNRETLRSMIPFEVYIQSEDSKSRYEISTLPDEDLNKPFMIYEEFLRDSALIQSGNADFMFKDLNGFAKQVDFVSAKFPNLQKESFSVLSSLYSKKTAGVINLRLEELILDTDTINIYHEQIKNLSNPNIIKVDNPVDNMIISNLFQRFPMFAFLQNGVNGKGQMSLGRIVPTATIAQMQDQSLNWYHTKIQPAEKQLNAFIDQYVGKFDSMYKTTFVDELGNVVDIDTSIRPIMKQYGNFYSFDPGSSAFITPTTYRSDLKVYNVRDLGRASFIKQVKAEIDRATKEGKTKIFVVNNTKPTDALSKSESGPFYSPSILMDMVDSGQIDAKHVFGLTTKKNQRYILTSDDFLTDKVYTQNIDLLEKQLQELKSLADDPNVELVFDADGVGLPLLGYGRNEKALTNNTITPFTASIKKTDDDQVIFSAPAPKTYVYLSKRLFEMFGYVNTNLNKIGPAMSSAKELRQEIFSKEKITNAEVQEVIKNCLINTLG